MTQPQQKTSQHKVVLATGNAGKVREIAQRLGDRFELVSQVDMGVVAPEETGFTFVENAIIKARAASQQTGLPAIADDSGLAVDALAGAPGIYSARYAGADATDADNIQKLLNTLEGLPLEKRGAQFRCALVYMRHALDPTPIICEGEWRGHILVSPEGRKGFGYDPVFYALEQASAAANLSSERKNQVSHRGKAINQLISQLNTTGD